MTRWISRAGLTVFAICVIGSFAQENSPAPEKVFRAGGDVSAPRAIYVPDPDYPDEARKKKIQGTVILSIVVGSDGSVHDVKIKRSVGYGLDEKAMEAVSQWQFEPGRKEGKPVAVPMDVEVTFLLQ